MSKGNKNRRQAPAPSEYITIPVAEYVYLNRMAHMLDIIMHDHTYNHEAVGVVKNVLIANGLRNEAGVEE